MLPYRFRPFTIVCFLLAIAPSCSRVTRGTVNVPEPEDYVAITDTVAVTALHCELPSLRPRMVFVSDNNLLVANESKDHIFNVFSLPLDGKGFSAVHYGRGPEELIDPDFKSMTALKRGGFMVADSDGYVKMYHVNGGKVDFSGKVRFADLRPLNGVIKLGDEYIHPNTELKLNPSAYTVIKNDGEIEYLGEFPDWDSSIEPNQRDMYYANNHIAHPDGKRFAEFYFDFRRVRILDDKGNVLSETSVNYPSSSERIPFTEGFFCMYGAVPCTDGDRIVAFAENAFRWKPDGEVPRRSISEYQVWDWNGHLLRRFIVKEHLELFTVDFKTGTFYGIDPERADVIFTADIHNLLK